MRRPGPRPIAEALGALTGSVAPPTLLGRVQHAWAAVAGDRVAEEARPVSERAGTVTVSCRSAVWAQELELLSPDLVARLNEALGDASLKGLRFRVGGDPGALP